MYLTADKHTCVIMSYYDSCLDSPSPFQVRADVRTITSDVFATRYSLRFPRVERLRTDKAPRDATSVRELEELVARGGACVLVSERGHGRDIMTNPPTPSNA